MVANKWIVDSASNVFIAGGPYEPRPGDGQIVVTMPDETRPDTVNERYDETSSTLRRPATAAELASALTAAQQAQAQAGIDAAAAAKAAIAYALSLKLGRDLTVDDVPAVEAAFTKAKTYYQFILANGL